MRLPEPGELTYACAQRSQLDLTFTTNNWATNFMTITGSRGSSFGPGIPGAVYLGGNPCNLVNVADFSSGNFGGAAFRCVR